jgi:hypothetical protein
LNGAVCHTNLLLRQAAPIMSAALIFPAANVNQNDAERCRQAARAAKPRGKLWRNISDGKCANDTEQAAIDADPNQ